MDKVYPADPFEGIKIHDWEKWEDPFRLTMDAYWKYQSEKERKLYAIIDAFQQNNGHLNVSDGRYVNTLKLFLTGSRRRNIRRTAASRCSGAVAGVGPRRGADAVGRRAAPRQTQVHTISQYNKYFNGMHDSRHMHDRMWYLSVPKSYFEDAMPPGRSRASSRSRSASSTC